MQRRRLLFDAGFWIVLLAIIGVVGILRWSQVKDRTLVTKAVTQAENFAKAGDLDKSAAEFRRAMKASKGKTAVYLLATERMLSIGKRKNDKKAYEFAAEFASETIKEADANRLNPKLREEELVSLLLETSDTYVTLNRVDDAVKLLNRALGLRPEDPFVQNWVGYTYAVTGRNLDKALDLVQNALKAYPNNPAIIDSLGWVYFKQGKYQEALAELKRAVILAPSEPELRYHLGAVYEKLGMKMEAELELRKALILNPNLDDAHSLLRRLQISSSD